MVLVRRAGPITYDVASRVLEVHFPLLTSAQELVLGVPRFDAPSGEQAATRAECLGCLYLRDFFQYTRAADYSISVSVHAPICLVRRTNCVPFLLKIVQLCANLTQPGPHP